MPEIEILSQKTKELRQKMKLSQMEFAAECGISTETLSLIERGKTDPKLSTIQKIAAYTDSDVTSLLTCHKTENP